MSPRSSTVRPIRPDSSVEQKVNIDRLWLDLEATRRAIARSHAPTLLNAARGLMAGLASAQVHGELAHAAAAFAEGEDERPDAEAWAFFAVAARAALESARKSGASILTKELEELDDAFEDVREAVLLLEPEDYKEALAATPPNTRVWWGERARIDAGLREIDLERALSDLAE